MQTRPFGRTGVRVAAVGQGTWGLEREERSRAVAALRRGLDLGLAHVDTAEMYGAGRVEELVGEAIAGRREEVFLASKVMPSNASFDGTIAACERSLRRLGTDWLDLYLLHWPSAHPLEQTFAAFERLVEQGKVRHWGVSNFDLDALEQAVRLAGPGRLACNQVLYNLEERYAELQLLDSCRLHGVALVAYSPFGSGLFPPPASHGGRALAAVAAHHRASPRQVALAFLLRDPAVFAIPKSSDLLHLEQNAAAADLQLAPDEIEVLDRAFAARGAELPYL